VRGVIIPAAITDIYTDMRILLGWAWTYLIVAEVVGTMSGITFFINQQARYRNFDNVFAAIGMIGIIGLTSDIFLAWLGTVLFPWKRKHRRRTAKPIAISMIAVQNRGEENPAEVPGETPAAEAPSEITPLPPTPTSADASTHQVST
jgi:NitT/TauT family transport system permease protein